MKTCFSVSWWTEALHKRLQQRSDSSLGCIFKTGLSDLYLFVHTKNKSKGLMNLSGNWLTVDNETFRYWKHFIFESNDLKLMVCVFGAYGGGEEWECWGNTHK